ncbi:hypothetical protein [uncultured Vagococcus sp.]|uniref:type IV toxin-antitoxin system AbiEi family antitoxin domain-containing protein n=1 Tax=uncultured Vagococcus sp. TaxID=189676 RepID=UPI0028D026C4|nr:hypothetical protein [uncultured Vagococcus sp.]
MLSKKVLAVFEKYNGTLPTKLAHKNGIDKETLRKAYLRGDIERPFRGVYLLPNSLLDDLFSTQVVLSKGIYSHETAMMLYGYSTFVPHEFHMTFPQGYHNATLVIKKVRARYVANAFYTLGATQVKTWEDNFVTVYDRERTVLDMLSSPTAHEYEIEEMLTNYYFDKDKNIKNLFYYAKLLNLEDLLERVVVPVA